MNLIRFVQNLIFPQENICYICGEKYSHINEWHICHTCYMKLRLNDGKVCERCGKSLISDSNNKCKTCFESVRFFKKATSPLVYTGEVKRIIREYKFGGKSYYYKVLGNIMLDHLKKESNCDLLSNVDCIASVPMTRGKRARRGFNQTELIAKFISENTDISYKTEYFVKTKETSVQSHLTRLEREKNLKSAFEVTKKGYYDNRRVLLIDDILTTGSTADAAAKTLLEAGATEVYVATLATGENV